MPKWTEKPEYREKMLAAVEKARSAKNAKSVVTRRHVDRILQEHLKPSRTLAAVEEAFKRDLGIKKDWAAEIAHAIFVGNRDRIYDAFSRQLFKGDSRAFNALANRAYGMPSQELAFSQEKPFKLVIEFIGEKTEPETITIEGEAAEKPARLAAKSQSEDDAGEIDKS